jgi:hypothetical protein
VIPTRESPVSDPNEKLQALPPEADEGNAAWFRRAPWHDGVILLGGSALIDFRVRVAQSQLRSDLTPSYWSLCGLIRDDGSLRTVPFQFPDASAVPRTNAVRTMSIDDFDDPADWPNIAIVRFADNGATIEGQADRVAERRSVVDLPGLLLDWLAFGWATEAAANPLLRGRGMPSAAFVEAAHALAGIELTPGLSSAASCPEAIWQAVKWWHEYYAGTAQLGAAADAQPLVPVGRHALRQRSAAVRLAADAPLFMPAMGKPAGSRGSSPRTKGSSGRSGAR